MGRSKKRDLDEESSSSSSKIDPNKKPYPSSAASNYRENSTSNRHSSQKEMGKDSLFVSYLDAPNLSPKVKVLCEIIANTPSVSVEQFLEDTGIRVSQEDVEQVLKLSYSFPGPAVKFFRWAGFQLNDRHSPYAWNLVVDLLGKNSLFDAMWDAIKSMRKEGLVSLATFASVFSSYVIGNRVQDAIMTFEVMNQYGCPRDIVALNSLLSAICREGKTQEAKEFLGVAKDKIRPDMDTYAILLEGWENEIDVRRAKLTFEEMVIEIGWDPTNGPAYDSFLTTLIKGKEGMHEVLKFFTRLRDKGCYPGTKFFKIALEECVSKSDAKSAEYLWEAIIRRNGCRADTEMYNLMIALQCNLRDFDFAKRMLDEMACNGAFPNSETYNLMFHFLVKSRRLKEASPIFTEMVKNECVLSHANCFLAIRTFLDSGDARLAIKVWKYMIDTYDSDLEESGNYLVAGLREINRLPEALKYAEDMIERGIKLNSATLSKLKQSLSKLGKGFVYEELLRKWKNH